MKDKDDDKQFWTWFRSGLRRLSQLYPPIYAALAKAKRPYNGPNKRQKVCYECAECGELYSSKEVAVDHVIPAGKLQSKSDIAEFVDKLFCGESGLQVLCKSCHDLKSYIEKTGLSKEEAISRKEIIAFSKLPVNEMKNVLTCHEKYETIRSVVESKAKPSKKFLTEMYEQMMKECEVA